MYITTICPRDLIISYISLHFPSKQTKTCLYRSHRNKKTHNYLYLGLCLVLVIWTVSNVKIGLNVKYLLLLSAAKFYNLWQIQVGLHSRYYKGALTQKRSFLLIYTAFKNDFLGSWKNQNKHSTLNSSFDALSNDMNQT